MSLRALKKILKQKWVLSSISQWGTSQWALNKVSVVMYLSHSVNGPKVAVPKKWS